MKQNLTPAFYFLLFFLVENNAKAQSNTFPTDGNVGIGTTSPALKLEIKGSDALINGLTIGKGSGYDESNTAIGSRALFSNTVLYGGFADITGRRNTAVGASALFANRYGYGNTAIGADALSSNLDGESNTAVGALVLTYSNGGGNTAIGVAALHSNNHGGDNTAVGCEALRYNSSGMYNTAVGSYALRFNIGSANTALGNNADVAAYPYDVSNSTALGYSAKVNASDKVRIGDIRVTIVESQTGMWTPSDARFKNNISDDVKGLEFIKQLRPVTYNFNFSGFEEFLLQNFPDSVRKKRMDDAKESIEKLSQEKQTGFIAQDVETAGKKTGFSIVGLVHSPDNPADNWSLCYEKLVVPLVKAVQELSQQNDMLRSRMDKLELLLITPQPQVQKDVQIQKETQWQQNVEPQKNNEVKNQAESVPASNTVAKLGQIFIDQYNATATVSYYLPSASGNAHIDFYNEAGSFVKSVKVGGSGYDKTGIRINDMPFGNYKCVLVIDDKMVDSRLVTIGK